MGLRQATKIIVDETFKETHPHGTDGFPLKFYDEDFFLFDFHSVDWHWHPELEILYAEQGSFYAYVSNETIEVKEGEALFINAKALHRFTATATCKIPNVVFSPTIMAKEGSLIFKKYVLPVIESSTEYLHLRKDGGWRSELIKEIIRLLDAAQEEKEIDTVISLLKIFENMVPNLNNSIAKANKQSITVKAQVQILLEYLGNNYMKNIALGDLARAVSLSKSSVLNLFKEHLHESPINCLTRYRLSHAASMLKLTEASIDVIALNSGFNSSSYFCRVFKREFGITPSQYRLK